MGTATGRARNGFADVCCFGGGLLYLAAFALPYGDWKGWHSPGYEIFYLGMVFCWLPGAGLPFWWANLLMWYAVVTYGTSPWRAAWVASAATFLGLAWYPLADGTPGVAYWAWVGGMAVVAGAAAARARRPAAPDPPAPEDW